MLSLKTAVKKISSRHSHLFFVHRQGFTTIDAHLGRKLVGDSKSAFRELSKGEPTLLGSEKNVKSLCNIR
jgi:hypothetical protein